MTASPSINTPVFEPQPDSEDLVRFTQLLEKAHPKLMGMDGEEIPLPESIYKVLRQVTPLLTQGKGVTILPQEHLLTTQEAANLLNISRPHLYKLLDRGDILFTKIGSHRRVKTEDVLSYRQKRDNERKMNLDRLISESQELGFYEVEIK
ncbi:MULTISPECIES: helix-turn-helix domain-containing protein [Spirulina sp. CCY15215]|uniref:helix-turn-helix domain-containing protein n=1 Tax=Spirulina sp. CCY15215 TaxID=2767591 RepID=UPI001950D340|nr:helix-turn-helix domain-containing protein [Spirulina major]